jgi:hypothetical protein
MKAKSSLVGLIAATVLIGVFVPSASAREWYIEGVKLSAGRHTEELVASMQALEELKLKSAGIEITCGTLKSNLGFIKEFIEGGFNSLKFTGCSVQGAEKVNCEVENGSFEVRNVEFFLEGIGFINMLEGAGSKQLGSFTVINKGGNNCTIKKEYVLKGSLKGRLTVPENEQTQHFIKFDNTTGSNFTIAGLAGEFVVEMLGELKKNTEKWSAKNLGC